MEVVYRLVMASRNLTWKCVEFSLQQFWFRIEEVSCSAPYILLGFRLFNIQKLIFEYWCYLYFMMFLKAKHKILRRRKYGWLFYYVYFHLEILLYFLNLHSFSFCYHYWHCPGRTAAAEQNANKLQFSTAKIRFLTQCLPLHENEKASSVLSCCGLKLFSLKLRNRF